MSLITDRILSRLGSHIFSINVPTIKVLLNYNQSSNYITESVYVSSVTDNSTGNFDVTVTNTWANTNYSWAGMFRDNDGGADGSISRDSTDTKSTTVINYVVTNSSASVMDSSELHVLMQGEL
jgi:hypothetical protein